MAGKRRLKLLLALAYAAAGACARVVRRGGRHSSCTVLYYHAVPAEQRSAFARQMDALVRLATPISAAARGLPRAAGHHVAVTFDDGFQSVVDHALPEMQRRGIPATLFVPTGFLGRRPGWIEEDGAADAQEAILGEEQLASLASSELVTIGSHTVSHPRLPELQREDALRELVESRSALEALLQRPVRLFAFPYGAHDERTIDLCRQAGYERVFTISPGPALQSPDELVTGRILVDPGDTPLEFRLKASGAYGWMRWASALKRRLAPAQRRGEASAGGAASPRSR